MLGLDNATVGRRLALLEERLAVRLVERLPRAARLTALGKQAASQAAAMEKGALAIERLVRTARSQEQGMVVITAPPVLARHFLAPRLRDLVQRHPLVQLSILSQAHVVSLARLDADLALRLTPPIGDADIACCIGRMPFAQYAARDYPYTGQPERWEFIAYTAQAGEFAHLRWLNQVIDLRRVVCEVADLSNQYEAACSGIGVPDLPCFIGDADPWLQRLPDPQPGLTLDVWIALHPDRRNDQRVRATMRDIVTLVGASDLAT